ARLQTVQRRWKGILPDRVVDNRDALTSRDLLDSLDEVLARVYDGVRTAVGLRQRGFFVGADSADQGHAERAGPLARDQSHPACRGMEENGFAAFQREGLTKQILDREAFQHQRRRRPI